MDIRTFGQTIKQKYPQYNNVDDEVLGNMVIQKYPQYSSQVKDATKSIEQQQKEVNLKKSQLSLEEQQKSLEYVPSFQRPSLESLSFKEEGTTQIPSSQNDKQNNPVVDEISKLEKLRAYDIQNNPENADNINKIYDSKINSLDPSGNIMKTFQQEQRKASDADYYKKQVIDISKKMLDIINNKDKYNSADYKQIIDSYSSQLTVLQKEASNFGAALTGNELATLAGQIPVREEMGMSLPAGIKQFFTGVKPAQTGRVVDSDDVIARKLKILIPTLSGEKISQEALGNTQGTTKSSTGSYLQDTLHNVPGDIGNIAKGVVSLPGVLLSSEMKKRQEGGIRTPVDMIAEPLADLAKGWAESLYRDIGSPTAETSAEDIMTNVSENFKNRPVSTILDFLPLTQVGKLKGGAATPKSNVTTLPDIGPPNLGGSIKASASKFYEGIKSDAARRVVNPIPDSLLKSETMARELVGNITKSLTRKGMARELPQFVKDSSKVIDDFVVEADKHMGKVVLDGTQNGKNVGYMSGLEEALRKTNYNASNPDLVTKVLLDTQKKLHQGNMQGMTATSREAINNLRRQDNSNLNNWYKNGRQTTSEQGIYDALIHERNKYAREFLAKSSNSPDFEKLLNQQHVAIVTEPVLSRLVSAGSKSHGFWSAAFDLVQKSFNTIAEPVGTAITRRMTRTSGVAQPKFDLTKANMSQMPPIQSKPIEYIGTRPKSAPMSQPKRTKLVRDKRSPQGKPRFKEVEVK